MQPLSGNQPWPPNISDEHVSCTAPATENAFLQILFKSPTPGNAVETAKKPSRFAHFWQGAKIPCACHTKRHLNVQVVRDRRFLTLMEMCSQRRALFRLPKVLRTWCVLHSLTSKCASRHNSVSFFDISTSKSAPRMVCFLYFSSLIWPDGFAPAALASLLFDPPESQIIGKIQWFATFLPFRPPASSFFWLVLFSDLLSSSLLFSSLTLPTSAFSSVHIVGSLTSLNFFRQCIIPVIITHTSYNQL